MPLSHGDQVTLLKDILNNHQADCCGSVSECEQLERLVKSLMVNNQIDSNVKNILQEVYQYSQHGTQSADLDQHILSNQENLSQWVNDIDQFS
ncbi:YtzH-like family protein [Neobacillus drentensis]|uniref:YtzH-like family protein n=1 Tax=Neobacillus drentensis TaxID=220684 RepID=UPI002FFE20EC